MALTKDDEQLAGQIAMDGSTQLMLRYLFELYFALTDDPRKASEEVRTQLCEMTDTAGLPPLKSEIIASAKEKMKFLIGQLLDNTPPHTQRN